MSGGTKRDSVAGWDEKNFKGWFFGEGGEVTGPEDLLDRICAWINDRSSTVTPEQVFDARWLEEWAAANGFFPQDRFDALVEKVSELEEQIEEMRKSHE